MNTELVQITPHTEIAPSFGGSSFFESGEGLFKLKPSNVELQQKTSRSEGSQEGKFRVSSTGEHFEEMHCVLIFDPKEKRSMYASKNEFGVPPLCYSNDAVSPSERAQQPQSLSCKNCKQNNWETWKKSHNTDDLPKCKNRWELTVVDRVSKIPFKLGVRGKSISKMRAAMETITMMAQSYRAQHGKYPNLYDFSFKVKSLRKVDNSGVYYEMVFSEIGLVKEEDRSEFGALFEQFIKDRASYAEHEEAEAASGAVDSEMSESTAKTVEAEYVQPKTTSDGEVQI